MPNKIIQNFHANRVGFGSDFNGGTGLDNRAQICVFSQTCSNGTYTFRTHAPFSENGYTGHFYLTAVTGGQGVSRIYRLTGRYALTTLTMVQGGTRSSGEDAYIQTYNTINNNLGLQVVVSGFTSNVDVAVMWVGSTGVNSNFWLVD